MIIELDELNVKNSIEINQEVLKDEELDKRIFDLKDAYVKGKVRIVSNSEIILECNFKGTMIIADSITLEPIPYPFSIDISENLAEISENYDNVYEKSQNTLDLKRVLWQNIVLEVPISFTNCKDALIRGNGWELRNENKKVEEIDPRLEKLKDLLKGDD